MQIITISKGKTNDISKTFYLAKLKPDFYYYDDQMFCDCMPCCVSYEIILKTDSGCYPCTAQEITCNDQHAVIDQLLGDGIIAKDSEGYFQGPKYKEVC